MNRRDVSIAIALAALTPGLAARAATRLDLRKIEEDRVIQAADRFMGQPPVTIAAFPAPRGPGGRNDYYSEADYWWPNAADPAGPYVRRDGFSNPAKFVAHREAVIHLSVRLPALASAWRLTGRARYAEQAERHLQAWFVDPQTRMNPNLEHAQAIIGVNTGRGIGVIDTLHLVEVARAVEVLRTSGRRPALYAEVTAWFARYLSWMTTSKNGVEERDQKNNHGTCWVLQAATFASLTGDLATTALARQRFKQLVAGQIAADGSQPLELARTKPYGYCLFNLDVMATCAWILSTPDADLWRYKGANGGSVADALAWMAPFIADKTRWPHAPDVEAFAHWPVRHPSLLFGGLALDRQDYLDLWRTLEADPSDDEIVRNYPIRQPLLWLDT